MKTLFWMTLLAVSLAASRPALARGGGGGGAHLKKVLEELNLTDEQKTKIKEVREGHGKAMKQSRASLKEARQAMEEAVKSDASKGDLLKKFESLQELRNKMGKARFEMILAVREILTSEQRQKFGSTFKEGMGRRHKERAEGKEED